MKRKRMTFAMACLLGAQMLSAQATIYDAVRVTGNDLNGTARYVGMGGAMGALGGDITTMSTNPAGIGIYRSSDAMVSFGLQNVENNSKFGGATTTNDKTFGSFDNLGFVYSYEVGKTTPVRYVNFGFNYHKSKSFDSNSVSKGTYTTSLTQQMANMSNLAGATESEFQAASAYNNSYIPWLGILGYDSYVNNPAYFANTGKTAFLPYSYDASEIDGVYRSRVRGGLHDFDFNVALNLSDRAFVGITLGAHYLDYSRTSTYSEDFYYDDGTTGGGYDLTNYYDVDGSGIDLKIGTIIRPIEDSPFRFGIAISTPTFYRLTEYTSAAINYDVDAYDNGNYTAVQGSTYTQDSNGNSMESETTYKVFTPWKCNLSLGYTVGKEFAIGAEYEYADYSTIKMNYDDGEEMTQENEDASNMLKAVHTFKIGAEYKVIPEFAVRVGYNHVSAAMKDDAFKWLPSYSTRTDAEYSNLKAVNNYTFGIGYRGSSFYCDLAYVYSARKESFHAFHAYDLDNSGNFVDNAYLTRSNLTKQNNNISKVVLTLGMKF
jgi:hypothetical protein